MNSRSQILTQNIIYHIFCCEFGQNVWFGFGDPNIDISNNNSKPIVTVTLNFYIILYTMRKQKYFKFCMWSAIFRRQDVKPSRTLSKSILNLSSLIFLVATRCCRLSPADVQRALQSDPAATPAGAGADELSWRLQRTLRLPAGTSPSLYGRGVNPSLPPDSQIFVHNYS